MHKLVIAAGIALIGSVVHAQTAPRSPAGLVVPAANGAFKVGAVRDPDGLFAVLIDSPRAQ